MVEAKHHELDDCLNRLILNPIKFAIDLIQNQNPEKVISKF